MTGVDDSARAFMEWSRQRGNLASGVYKAVIAPWSVAAFKTAQAEGVSFRLRIVEGAFHDREFTVRLHEKQDRAPHVVTRDMTVLAAWATALNVTGGDDLVGLVIGVGRETEAAGGVSLRLEARTARNGLEDISIISFTDTMKGNRA